MFDHLQNCNVKQSVINYKLFQQRNNNDISFVRVPPCDKHYVCGVFTLVCEKSPILRTCTRTRTPTHTVRNYDPVHAVYGRTQTHVICRVPLISLLEAQVLTTGHQLVSFIILVSSTFACLLKALSVYKLLKFSWLSAALTLHNIMHC